MAGLAGATEGNGNCGVGVSFKASLSGTCSKVVSLASVYQNIQVTPP